MSVKDDWLEDEFVPRDIEAELAELRERRYRFVPDESGDLCTFTLEDGTVIDQQTRALRVAKRKGPGLTRRGRGCD